MPKLTKIFLPLFLLAFAVAPAAAGDAPMSIPGATTVDADGVIDLIETHADLVVLDNRKESDYDGGHIEGAIRLIDTDVSEESLSQVVSGKDVPVLMYCNGLSCGRGRERGQGRHRSGLHQRLLLCAWHGRVEKKRAFRWRRTDRRLAFARTSSLCVAPLIAAAPRLFFAMRWRTHGGAGLWRACQAPNRGGRG